MAEFDRSWRKKVWQYQRCPDRMLSFSEDLQCYLRVFGGFEQSRNLAIAFHARFKLSPEHKSIKYSLGNAFEMTINVIQNPLPFNFTQVEAACCRAGKLNAESFCSPQAKLCSNCKNYLLWDLFHPTQAASKLAAVTLYNCGPQFIYPINFAQLTKA